MRNNVLCYGLLALSSLSSLAQNPTPSSNASRLQHAAQAMTAGQLTIAEKDLQSVLRIAPDDYRALDLLGVVRVLQQNQSGAEQLFLRAIRKNPDFAPARAHLGLVYLQQNRMEEAEPQLREAVRIDPTRRDASEALVRILQDRARTAFDGGDYSKALPLLTEAEKYAPENLDVLSELGTVELRMSLWEDAVVSYRRILKLSPADLLALYNLGRAFMGLSGFEKARQEFARYVEARPEDASGHCALGMTLAALERVPEARQQFERSLVLAPDQTESYFRLGLIDLDAKNLDQAAANFQQVLSRDPKHGGALSGLGRVAFEQKRYSEAIDLLQRAVASDDSLREAHYYLGLTFAHLGRRPESEAQLQIATRLEHEEAQHGRTVLRIPDNDGDHPANPEPKP